MAEEFDEDGLAPLTREQVKELRRRDKDFENPIRYVVYDEFFSSRKRKWRLWHNSEEHIYCSDIAGASLYKCCEQARAVAAATHFDRLLGSNSPIRTCIAKITTKNNKRRILKYDV